MRIGLTGRGTTADHLVEHAQWAEEHGFNSLWYASVTAGDPLVAIALAGRATSRIELGTAVLQTYPCHPVLQANRAGPWRRPRRRPGFTLGIGPSHEKWVTMLYGMSFDHPGRSTEEYVQILTSLLRGQGVDLDGKDWSSHAPTGVTTAYEEIAARRKVPLEAVPGHPNALVGSPDAAADLLRQWREATGISYITVPQAQMEALAPVVARLKGT